LTIHTNDFTTFQYRLSLFEPLSVHVMELGELVFNEDKYLKLKKYWQEQKQNSIPVDELVSFLESRSKFYRNLKPKNLLEEMNRIERILAYNLQIWVFTQVKDLTVTEIAYLDIPTRLPKLVKYLYKDNLSEEILILASIYEQIYILKKNIKILIEGQEPDFHKLKDFLLQLQEYTDEIVNTRM